MVLMPQKRAEMGLKAVLNLLPLEEARENGLGEMAESEEKVRACECVFSAAHGMLV